MEGLPSSHFPDLRPSLSERERGPRSNSCCRSSCRGKLACDKLDWGRRPRRWLLVRRMVTVRPGGVEHQGESRFYMLHPNQIHIVRPPHTSQLLGWRASLLVSWLPILFSFAARTISVGPTSGAECSRAVPGLLFRTRDVMTYILSCSGVREGSLPPSLNASALLSCFLLAS